MAGLALQGRGIHDFKAGLKKVQQGILEGQLGSLESRNALETLISWGHTSVEPTGVRAVASEFSVEVARLAVTDPLPFRAAILAQCACQVARWTDHEQSATTAIECAQALALLGDHETALELLKAHCQAWQCSARTVDRLVDVLRVHCCFQLSRYVEADALIAAVEAAFPSWPDDLLTVDLMLVGAQVASALVQNDVAERRVSKAAAVHHGLRKSGMLTWPLAGVLPAPSSARVHVIHGLVLRQSTDPLSSIEAFQRGREEGLREGDALGAAFCLSEIGITWEQMGDSDRGARILRHAASEAEAAGDYQLAARWRKTEVLDPSGNTTLTGFDGLSYVAARLRASPGKADLEAEAVAKAVVIEARGKNSSLEAQARNILAGCYGLSDRFHQALVQVELAVQIAQAIQNRWLTLVFRSNQANLLMKAGRFLDAETAATDALSRAMEFQQESSASEVRQNAAAAVANSAEVLYLLWGLETQSPTGRRTPEPNKVVGLSQLVRSRNFDFWMALANWAQEHGSDSVGRVVRRVVACEMAVERASYVGAMLTEPLRELAAARLELSRTPARTPLPTFRAERDSTLQRAVDCLDEETLILDLSPVESGIIGVVAGRQSAAKAFEISWTRGERIEWMERWRALYDGPASRVGRRRVPRSMDDSPLAIDDEEYDRLTQSLYADLDCKFVGPMAEHIGANHARIICAMHAELYGVPVWSLARALPDLVLSIVPSISSVSLLAGRPSTGGQRCIKIGDATGTLEMVPYELSALTSFESLEPARSIVAREMMSVRRIHFAGHGAFIQSNPYESGIILRGEADEPRAVLDEHKQCVRLTLEGLVHDWHVAGSDLVVLSACSTGIPRAQAASEFTSVATALLVAGARNVVAASWPADDVSAALLMRAFYDFLDEHGSPGRALAGARTKLLGLDRTTATAMVGSGRVPFGERPFSSPIFSDTFVHFGIS